MDTFEICAVLRCNHPSQRYINPSDVQTITEWLEEKETGYGGLKEEVKYVVATLGESRMETWLKEVDGALDAAKGMGWDGFDMFEEEDPRRHVKLTDTSENLKGLEDTTKTAGSAENLEPQGGEQERLELCEASVPQKISHDAVKTKENSRKPAGLLSSKEVQGARKTFSNSDWHREEMLRVLRGNVASGPKVGTSEGRPKFQHSAMK